ncbi:MAG: flagellar basal body rod protein FlgB [Gammaproteobacteria bacterium]|nr:flagellar basal body rod protein FlgB [Gammaproteobacteria bacterium]
MSFSIDNALGIHEAAIKFRSQRAEVLASNMANADTPNFKARDINFQEVLANQSGGDRAGLRTTHPRHIQTGHGMNGAVEMQYRVPNQPSVDGNTVDTQVEKTEFMQNALHYQASLTFIDGRLKGLKSAFRGD